jgi:hypothetical protein
MTLPAALEPSPCGEYCGIENADPMNPAPPVTMILIGLPFRLKLRDITATDARSRSSWKLSLNQPRP